MLSHIQVLLNNILLWRSGREVHVDGMQLLFNLYIKQVIWLVWWEM